MNNDKETTYKDTLNLPTTNFPIRPKSSEADPAMIQRWQEENLYTKTFVQNEESEKYILHDGPPYANGHIHIGHAYNKILKDIITKAHRMMGKHVPVTPGWDCHGLPIEQKVAQEHVGASRAELKQACRAYAQKWIDVQREEFKRLGVLMDWDHPYTTMSHGYEASILQAFGDFVAGGYIERKNKTIPWCFTCQTVLATAEIEYQERKDPSIYVLFALEADAAAQLFPALAGCPINFLVWTTTPWTLPLNRAVLLNPTAQYVVLELNGTYIITAAQLADSVAALVGAQKKVVAQIDAAQFIAAGAHAHHPFVEGLTVPVILDSSVMVEDGTACVHSAPGCGPEDYEVGTRNGLEIFSPLSADGKYTFGIAPVELQEMSITDGQIWVLKKLTENNKLFHKTTIRHPFPHCWRCHNGLMFRATKQWFCDLSKDGLKERVLQAIDGIQTVPEKSVNRLKSTVEGRLEWCLSRQRVWGVPIPALLCVQCDYAYCTSELINAVAAHVAQEGIEYWDTVLVKEVIPNNFSCPKCAGTEFKKEHDILDVWFDSGVSHFAVLSKNPALRYPADVYVEGKDQHRGWFQSSLLTALVLHNSAPMRTIVTHGFTVDEKGRKMSKSIGNVVAPQQMIERLGTDGLRLWASANDFSSEAVVSEILLKNVTQVLHKIRNTSRCLLSNLYDFDKEKDEVSFESMFLIDQYALQQLHEKNKAIIKAYEEFDLVAIFHALGDYCSVDLSAFYLDIVKDRLYVEKSNGHARRSAQTAYWYIVDTLTRLIAPILSFTAEEISDYYQKNKTTSIHLQSFASLSSVHEGEPLTKEWAALKTIRSALLKAIEELREKGIVKHSLEADVTVYFDPKIRESIAPIIALLERGPQTVKEFFKECMIVSQFDIVSEQGECIQSELPGLYVLVRRAQGQKCPRCWHWDTTAHAHGLCARCQEIV
jgi:isoleucyl-tRNA synthetase